jgi:hypothetical protein
MMQQAPPPMPPQQADRQSVMHPVQPEMQQPMTLAALVEPKSPEQTPYSVTKTMRTGQRGTVLPPDESAQLSDLLNEYKSAGYDKYKLSGGQLIDDGGQVMMNATPDDINRYKEYQRAQLMAGANETGGGYGRKKIVIQGSAPVNRAPSPAEVFQKQAMQALQDPSIPMAQKIQVYQAVSKGEDLDSVKKRLEVQKLQRDVSTSPYDAELNKARAVSAAQSEAAKMPGTPEYTRAMTLKAKDDKAKASASAAQKYANDNADSIETAIADILGVPREKLPEMLGTDTSAAQSKVSNAVGNLDARYPEFMKWQGTRNTSSAIESLKSKAQMYGLTNLRKSGVAPGSITEKEWPKFEAMLANIDPTLGEGAFIKQLKDIYTNVKSARESGSVDAQDAMSNVQGVPTQGSLVDGYVYLGGDPSSPNSWKIAQ